MIEAISSQHKTLKLTSMKWEEEDSDYVPSPWRFKATKRRLEDQARSSGLKLMVEEMAIENLVSEMKRMKGWKEIRTVGFQLHGGASTHGEGEKQ